ncbi:hypothetical protein EDC96DRAFT_426177, partial [Choanephora cucurbitarum]
AFVRPSDLARIPPQRCMIIINWFVFQTVNPEETHGCHSIIENYSVYLHHGSF